jgi:flavin reductase (DIM6/NTAB) family NADH-FMN oxidoreductase RutF
MRIFRKQAFPVDNVRRFLEPGPIVLVSSRWNGASNIMTMGWHTVMECSPSLIGCCISSANHSFDMIRRSKECVINIPTFELRDAIVGIGNCSGQAVDKFRKFQLTPVAGVAVKAPSIAECYASFECRIADASLVRKYDFFVLEVVRARVAASPKYPRTVHYRGDGRFMVSGSEISRRRKFRPENL